MSPFRGMPMQNPVHRLCLIHHVLALPMKRGRDVLRAESSQQEPESIEVRAAPMSKALAGSGPICFCDTK